MALGRGYRRRRDKGEHPTRRLLIATTLNVLDEQGFDGMLLEDIVDRAGVTKGALYHHFESFTELVDVALNERFDTTIAEELDALIGAEGAVDADGFFVVLGQLLVRRDAAPSPQMWNWVQVSVLSGARASLRERLADGQQRLLAGYAAAVANGCERGWVHSAVDSEQAAVVLVSLRQVSPLMLGTDKRLLGLAIDNLLERYLRA